jgi:VanZ family protein
MSSISVEVSTSLIGLLTSLIYFACGIYLVLSTYHDKDRYHSLVLAVVLIATGSMGAAFTMYVLAKN